MERKILIQEKRKKGKSSNVEDILATKWERKNKKYQEHAIHALYKKERKREERRKEDAGVGGKKINHAKV